MSSKFKPGEWREPQKAPLCAAFGLPLEVEEKLRLATAAVLSEPVWLTDHHEDIEGALLGS